MNNSVLRQSHLFLALLILLWGLILCFVGYQYTREREQVVELLNSRLQLLNLQLCDEIKAGINTDDFYYRNVNRFDDLEIAVVCGGQYIANNYVGQEKFADKLSAIDEAKSNNSQSVVQVSSEYKSSGYICAFTNVGDYTICSSCRYSLSFLDIFTANNTFLIVAIAISLLISVIGYITSRLYANLDITIKERNREQEAARREEQDKLRLKRQLTNNINHELKTPICSILGYMEMILNNPNIDYDQAKVFVSKSFVQAERLRSLMLDLSTITRIDEAAGMIERERVDLTLLINDVIDDVLPQVEKQNISIINMVDSQIYINGNQSLLYSVFRNLVDNAIAYSGARNIWIELLSQDDTKYYFSLRDNGIGVDKKHLPYIFERFYRVDKGRSRKVGGTGLGLSIVKNAVLFHSGTIEAHIEEMGGLEFRFSLGDKC